MLRRVNFARVGFVKVFEAADKEVSDDSVGKKGSKQPPAKDVGEAMGDMLSNFFGGGGDKK